MILLKCILAGLLALLIAAIVLPMSVCVYLTWTVHPGHNEAAIGFDPISMARSSPSVWIIAVTIFGLGFYLQYRRLKARQRSPARS
ncbi:MAG: hypothetical protein ABSE79_12025 [Terriglobia bacterium]|jgi:fatty-acid desaturase